MSNPEYMAYGSKRMRIIEKDELGEFRDANEYLRGSRLANTTGYYCDEFCDTTAVPALYVLTSMDDADNECFVYYAAVHDPNNDGCGIVDFEEYYADGRDAALAAHCLAERYANSEREYNENENRKIQLENVMDDVRELRNRHSYLIRALPHAGDDATGARMRESVRNTLSKTMKTIRQLRSQIKEG